MDNSKVLFRLRDLVAGYPKHRTLSTVENNILARVIGVM